MTTLVFAGNSVGGSSQSGGIASFIPLIIIFLIVYFVYGRMKNKFIDISESLKKNTSDVETGWKLDRILILVGAIGLILASFMDTSILTAAGRVNNIGLMNDKQNYLIISGILLFLGIILNVSNKRNRSSQTVESTFDESEYKTCPYCAERIKIKAKICRFCNREQDIES